jgi:hypothetical protein
MVSVNLPLWLCFALLVAVVALASGAAVAQGPAGATGAIASIPSSVVRAGEQGQPVTQPGIFSIFTSPTPPGSYAVSNPRANRREERPPPSK